MQQVYFKPDNMHVFQKTIFKVHETGTSFFSPWRNLVDKNKRTEHIYVLEYSGNMEQLTSGTVSN